MQDATSRDTLFWQPEILSETRDDGTIYVWQKDPLPAYPDRLSDRIAHWASVAPDRVWMAERGPDDAWRKVTYGEMFAQIRAIGQRLLDLDLSTDRPLVILSGNSIAHGLMALGAQYVGIPSAALAPAYALVSGDYAKLKGIRGQITPGAVVADTLDPVRPAIEEVFPDLPRLAVEGTGLAVSWDDLVTTPITPSVDAANAATGPDTVAKFMFTSGTTGSPKAVILTQRMMCANMAMVADCFAFFRDEPPVLLDWAPWNHVASGTKVFNLTIYNGGTYHIDQGKPTPKLIGETIRNLRDVSPNWYFNVPVGYEMLITAMKEDKTLAECFFRNAKLMMYAGAAMAQHTWEDLGRISEEVTGKRVTLSTGLGATETTPFALQQIEYQETPGNVGVPSKGLTLKLVPNEGKYEARLKGPSVTPGYWRNDKLTAEAFDDEGFYCLGDALRFADESDPSKGFFFDGRVAENFKMATGTWVAVGALRGKLNNALEGLAADVVIAGEGHEELGALLVPFRPAIEKVVPNGASLSDAELLAHPALRDRVETLLGIYNKTAGGSSLRVPHVRFLEEPLSLDKGEVTDKGSVNQRAVLRLRADLADSLFTDAPEVMHSRKPA